MQATNKQAYQLAYAFMLCRSTRVEAYFRFTNSAVATVLDEHIVRSYIDILCDMIAIFFGTVE